MTTTSSSPAIAVTGLRKSYGDKVVLDGIDLTVAEGTIFALLGPNGAGKTTAVQILSLVWACAIALVGYVWARVAYNRDLARRV